MAVFVGSHPKRIKYFDLLDGFFIIIIHSPNPAFVPSLSEIGDLSCIISSLVPPGFLTDALLIIYPACNF